MSLKSILESLIFASEKPLGLKQLCELTGSSNDQAREALAELIATYENTGLQLVEVSGGYHFRTNPENAQWVKRLLAGPPARLTRPMLETLAIVAYRQPITRPEIEEIRGVDSASTVRVLLDRNLIRMVGKKEEVGRPILFGTTKYFLEFFQLRDLKDLPTLKEFTELSEEHAQELEVQFGDGAAEEAMSLLRERRAVEEMAAFVEAQAGTDGAAAETNGATEAAEAPRATEPPAKPSRAVREKSANEAPADAGAMSEETAQCATPPSSRGAAIAEESVDPELEEEEALEALDRALARADGVLSEMRKQAKQAAPPPAEPVPDPDAVSSSIS